MNDILQPPEQIETPWTPDQVKGLNDYQFNGYFHPYTCENRGDGKHRTLGRDLGTLIATTEGWVCPYCSYEQNWAHAMSVEMANKEDPSQQLLRELKEKRAVQKDGLSEK
jgi:hypothetical protein